jgi:hypothetical protein
MIASRTARSISTPLFALALACATAAARPAAAVAPPPQATRAPGGRSVPRLAVSFQVVPEAAPAGAEQVREALSKVLDQYPPSLGRVLKSDPSLLDNQGYLAAFPAFTAFLASHPEIRRDPSFFFAQVRMPSGYQIFTTTPEQQAIQLWRSTLEGLAILFVFAFVTSAVVWLVKTLVEQRRWSRTARVQTDLQGKLFDRLSSNQDLVAWLDTPGGRRLLELAPVAAPVALPDGGYPLRRILWALQAGVVLLALGIGLEYVCVRVVKQVGEPLFAMGVLAIALGAGFIVSAILSFVLSRQLGVLTPARGGRGEA